MFELGSDGPSVILVGIDGSETSIHAAAYAVGLARRQGSRLVAVYVHTSGMPGGATVPSAFIAAAGAKAEVVAELQGMIESSRERWDVDVEFVERHGNPHREIQLLADEIRADAIVVGASTQAGHRILGSLAVALVKDARWPVTVVP